MREKSNERDMPQTGTFNTELSNISACKFIKNHSDPSQKSARDCDWFINIMPARNRIARSESIVPIISKYNHL